MKLLEQSGSLKGALSAHQQLSLISGCRDIQEAVEGAMHIQVSRGRGVAGGGRDPAPHAEETKAVKRYGHQNCVV